MAGYLEPVVAELKGDISDFLVKMEQAKAAMRSLNETASASTPFGDSGNLGEDIQNLGEGATRDAMGDTEVDGRALGEAWGQGFEERVKAHFENLGRDITRGSQGVRDESERVGSDAGRSFSDAFRKVMNETDRLSLQTDVLLEQSRRLGEDMGHNFGSEFDSIVSSEIVDGLNTAAQGAEQGGDGSFEALGHAKGALIVSGIVLGLAALPAAVITAGTLAMGGLGAYIEYKASPQVKKAFDGLAKNVTSGLKEAARPLEPYLLNVVTQLEHIMGGIDYWLERGFSAVGPLIGPLVKGIGSLVTLPFKGFVAMLAAPSTAVVINDVSKGLAAIGKGLSDMFAKFTGSGAEASGKFFEQLLTLVGDLLPVIADVSIWLAKMFVGVEPYLAPVLKIFWEFWQVLKDIAPLLSGIIKFDLLEMATGLELIGLALKPIVALFNLLAPYLKTAGDAIGGFASRGLNDVKKWASETPSFFGHVGHDISNWSSNVASATSGAWRHVSTDTEHWWNNIGSFFSGVWRWIGRTASDGWGHVVNAVTGNRVYKAIAKELDKIKDRCGQIWGSLVGLWNATGGKVVTWISDNFHYMATGVEIALGTMVGIVEIAWTAISGLFHTGWSVISGILKALWATCEGITRMAWVIISGAVRAGWNLIKGITIGAFDILKGLWRAGWDVISGVVKIAWHLITGIINTALDVIQGIIQVATDVFEGKWSKAWDDIKKAASNIWHDIYNAGKAIFGEIVEMIVGAAKSIGVGFVNGLLSMLKGVGGALGDIYHAVVKFFKDAGSWLYDIGKDIVQGLINGVESLVGSVINIAKSLGSKISGAFKSVLSIFSPSRVFFSHGQNIVQGLIGGIQSLHGQAVSASQNLANGVSRGFNASTGRLGMSGRGFGGTTLNVTVQGSVVTAKGLRRDLETLDLQQGARRSTTYAPYTRLAI